MGNGPTVGAHSIRPAATRVAVAVATAGLVLTAGALTPVPNEMLAVDLSADTTALIVCGTTCPTPDDLTIDIVRNQYIAPTHPGDIDYVPVTTPEEFWPISGVFRVVGLALGDPRLFGPGRAAWPDEPWWKLTGLFDLTANRSLRAGADDLEEAIAANENDHRVIYGISQGAGVANVVKRRLAEQYAGAEGPVPDIDFVLTGDPNLPNGGLASRFTGAYIPILDLLFNGPAATDTPFDTVEIARQYDGFSDFPLYPLNLLADLNALLGIVYVHMHSFDVSLPAKNPTTSPAYRGEHGDTSYYVFDNPDLPLFGPLRTLGVPEPLIDVVEPFFRVLVELGYDRSIPPWEPTPARLIPKVDPVTLTVDLVNAVGEGVNNALAVVGLPPLLKIPEPVTPAPRTDGAGTRAARTDGTDPTLATSTRVDTEQGAKASATEGRRKPITEEPVGLVAADEDPPDDTKESVDGSEGGRVTPPSPTPRRSEGSLDTSDRPHAVPRHRKPDSATDAVITQDGATPDDTAVSVESPSTDASLEAHGPSSHDEERQASKAETGKSGEATAD